MRATDIIHSSGAAMEAMMPAKPTSGRLAAFSPVRGASRNSGSWAITATRICRYSNCTVARRGMGQRLSRML